IVAFLSVMHGDRNGADAVGFVADAGIADGELIVRNGLHNGFRAGLLLDALLEVSIIQNLLFEKVVCAGDRVATIHRNRMRRPFAGQPGVAPRIDALAAAALAVGRKYLIQLLFGEALNWIVLMDVYG